MIMEPADWYIEGCTFASIEEIKQFNDWTSHLPKREESTPYHSGPHSIKQFRHALAIAGHSPDSFDFNVLEVGFCLGHSAEIFLQLGCRTVTSIEISDRKQTIEAMKIMGTKWGARWWGFTPDSIPKEKGCFQFGFIDGDHGFQAIRNDLALMRERRVPWVLFDDFWPHWGDTQIVFKEQGITPVAILGTMALCHFPA